MGESLDLIRRELTSRIGDIHQRAERLSPLDIHARMDAIRDLAAKNGMAALEGLARHSAQLALLPGCRIAMQHCLSHMDEALESRSPSDGQAILAAVAVRMH